jgi:dTMP kinase
MRGIFITFEGGEGSGKTTQMRLLAERLRREGREVVETVEPGGTRIGAQIRRILLDPANQDLRAMPEMLLYFASRSQNLEEVIEPALARGAVVLADRYTDSTMAYQGIARGLGEEAVRELHRIACHGRDPDLTLLIDIDPGSGLRRTAVRNRETRSTETRFDDEAADFHCRVRAGYLRMAGREPARFRVIDGNGDLDAVAAAVWNAVRPHVEGGL